jgi:toxin ParE1/3/4
MTERRRHVLWSDAASQDLTDLITYIAADSLQNARAVLAKLKRKAESLATAPQRGRIVPELAHFGIRTWRELVVRPYRIMYRVAADTVYMLGVFDGRRDLRDVLLERLLREK